jgi:hypothetical protein
LAALKEKPFYSYEAGGESFRGYTREVLARDKVVETISTGYGVSSVNKAAVAIREYTATEFLGKVSPEFEAKIVERIGLSAGAALAEPEILSRVQLVPELGERAIATSIINVSTFAEPALKAGVLGATLTTTRITRTQPEPPTRITTFVSSKQVDRIISAPALKEFAVSTPKLAEAQIQRQFGLVATKQTTVTRMAVPTSALPSFRVPSGFGAVLPDFGGFGFGRGKGGRGKWMLKVHPIAEPKQAKRLVKLFGL